jgi:hypothetical protein
MLRQANQYNVHMPITHINEVPFLRVKDTQEEILAVEVGSICWVETSKKNQPIPRNNPRLKISNTAANDMT